MRHWLAVLAVLLGCRGPKATPAPAPVPEGRFRHDVHVAEGLDWGGPRGAQRCSDCHRPAADGRLQRPGEEDHAPCDREQCHGAAFRSPPSRLCRSCHAPADGPLPTGELIPYPPRTGPRLQASRFSHAAHLDFGAMEDAVGFHVSCSDCHAQDEEGRLRPPDHATCGRCHAPEAVRGEMPSMGACERCHEDRSDPPRRQRRLIVGDLRFSHGRHRSDRRGKAILCSACHESTASVKEVGRHSVPPTSACVTCHDDERRVGESAAMKVCETCHSAQVSGLGAIAPRSHLPADERPANHTLAFRSDHEREARSSAQTCARCHSQLSGASHDVCDQCHQTMQPRSHTVGWREFEHGPAAAVERDSCATCHSADVCVACHSRPPRSHLPLAAFATEHGALAAFGLRSCLTCHDPSTGFCSSSGCHTTDVGARR